MSNPQAPHPQAHIFGSVDSDTLHATAARAVRLIVANGIGMAALIAAVDRRRT